MKQKPKNLDKVKANLTMIIAFMIFLFAYCYVMYTNVGDKMPIDLNETIEIEGGQDLISQRLKEIVPFSEVMDPSYLTAYQEAKVDNTEVANDIFLQMATNNSQSKSYSTYKDILERLYGNNLFIVFKNFNVNGKLKCEYDNRALFYQCSDIEYNGPLYTAKRTIANLKFTDNYYYLEELVTFYSIEQQNEITKYKVYSDYTYQNVVGEFTNKELNNQNIEDYLKQNYDQYNQKYQSKNTKKECLS